MPFEFFYFKDSDLWQEGPFGRDMRIDHHMRVTRGEEEPHIRVMRGDHHMRVMKRDHHIRVMRSSNDRHIRVTRGKDENGILILPLGVANNIFKNMIHIPNYYKKEEDNFVEANEPMKTAKEHYQEKREDSYLSGLMRGLRSDEEMSPHIRVMRSDEEMSPHVRVMRSDEEMSPHVRVMRSQLRDEGNGPNIQERFTRVMKSVKPELS